MKAAQATSRRDPVIVAARRRMLRAAAHYDRMLAELQPAIRALKAHPDNRRSVRLRTKGRPSREALSLAYWLLDGIHSSLEDMGSQAGYFLRQDARPGAAERTMAQFIQTEEQDLARSAKRAKRRAAREARA